MNFSKMTNKFITNKFCLDFNMGSNKGFIRKMSQAFKCDSSIIERKTSVTKRKTIFAFCDVSNVR